MFHAEIIHCIDDTDRATVVVTDHEGNPVNVHEDTLTRCEQVAASYGAEVTYEIAMSDDHSELEEWS